MLSRSLFLTGSPPPPTITSFSPASLNNGGGNVTVTGTNFISGATTVTIAGVAATTTVNSLTSLTVAFPSRARGTYTVVVSTPGGSASANFTHTWTPVISYITPSSVYYDYGSGYTIVGGNFSSSAASSVYVSNGGYYGISVASDGQLSFNPGAIGPGSFTAQVVAPDGWSNAVGFSTSYYPAPSISGMSTNRRSNTATPGTSITLSGSNFTGASVSIGGTAVSASVSDTSISFSCPSLAGDGAKTITVTTARSGNQSSSTSVTFYAARAASTSTYTSGGVSYAIPDWCNFVDIVCIGGGAAGDVGGAGYNNGKGGGAGGWGGTTIAASATTLSGSVGAGAPQTPSFGTPQGGGASTCGGVTGSGGVIRAVAAVAGSIGATGQSAGNFSVAGVTYSGGAGGAGGNSSTGSPGGAPGGGGGGGGGVGIGSTIGGAGGRGQVWIRAYQ